MYGGLLLTLPVRLNLLKRGMEVKAQCSLCGLELESVKHILRDCPWAAQVWFSYSLSLQAEQVKNLPTTE